jgi:hypothetical protein
VLHYAIISRHHEVVKMGFATGIYLFFIAGILLFAGAGLVWIINNNFNAGQRIREALSERIRMLRLGRMLKKRGISMETYLHEAAFHDIETSVRNCESCGKTRECDAALDVTASEKKELSFCPNDNALKKISGTAKN